MTTHDEPNGVADESNKPLHGHTALITGGGRGIGAACATEMAKFGADVIVTYRSTPESVESSARSCEQYSVAVTTTEYCLGVAGAEERLLNELARSSRLPDIVIVNASAPFPKRPLSSVSAAELTGKVSTDLGALHTLVTGCIPAMQAAGYGRVIVIGSMHALGPSAPGMALNGVSKAALATYLRYAVDEFSAPGVTLNTLHPGYIATDATAKLPPAIPEMLRHLTPAGRAGRPEDVAVAARSLADPAAGYLNGLEIPVAGGLNQRVVLSRVFAGAGQGRRP